MIKNILSAIGHGDVNRLQELWATASIKDKEAVISFQDGFGDTILMYTVQKNRP